MFIFILPVNLYQFHLMLVHSIFKVSITISTDWTALPPQVKPLKLLSKKFVRTTDTVCQQLSTCIDVTSEQLSSVSWVNWSNILSSVQWNCSQKVLPFSPTAVWTLTEIPGKPCDVHWNDLYAILTADVVLDWNTRTTQNIIGFMVVSNHSYSVHAESGY